MLSHVYTLSSYCIDCLEFNNPSSDVSAEFVQEDDKAMKKNSLKVYRPFVPQCFDFMRVRPQSEGHALFCHSHV